MTKSWDEAKVTWMKATATVSWTAVNSLFAGFANQIGGGEYDKAKGVVAKGIKVDSWFNTDISSMATSWVGNPSNNFGIIILGNDGNLEDIFASKENSETAQRPKLTITYTPTSVLNRSARVFASGITIDGANVTFPRHGSYSVSVCDASGRQISSVRGTGRTARLDLNGAAMGMTFAKVTFNGQTFTSKGMVSR